MNDVFALIAVERRELADVLTGLSDEQWSHATLCSGWRVREVAAHLVMPFAVSLPKLLIKMVANGFNFDKVADKWAKTEQRSNAELAKSLRDNVDNRFKPPGFGPEAPLTDVVVHGQDIRRPLGIAHVIAPDSAKVVLDLLVTKKATKGFVKKGLIDGLRFESTDSGWSHGSGPTVSGTAEALILTLSGRTAALAELSGDGAAQMMTRLSG